MLKVFVVCLECACLEVRDSALLSAKRDAPTGFLLSDTFLLIPTRAYCMVSNVWCLMYGACMYA